MSDRPDQQQPGVSSGSPDDLVRDLDVQVGDDAVKGGELANQTYVNRVKTSDKQQKAVLDFVKG